MGFRSCAIIRARKASIDSSFTSFLIGGTESIFEDEVRLLTGDLLLLRLTGGLLGKIAELDEFMGGGDGGRFLGEGGLA